MVYFPIKKPHKAFCLMRCKFFKISQNAVSRILSPSRARGGNRRYDLCLPFHYDGMTSKDQYRNPMTKKCRFKIIGLSHISGYTLVYPRLCSNATKNSGSFSRWPSSRPFPPPYHEGPEPYEALPQLLEQRFWKGLKAHLQGGNHPLHRTSHQWHP